MATSKKINEPKEEDIRAEQAAMPEQPMDDAARNGQDAEARQTEEPAPEVPQPELEIELSESPYKSLEELAVRFRVPTWQQAALVRFMGWAEGKSLTVDEYREALDGLGQRRLGGGRQ